MLAAANLMGADEPITAVPWFWSDQYELTLQSGLACLHRALRARVPRSLLLRDPPRAAHSSTLQIRAFGAPQLGQSVSLVIACHAPGRAPLFFGEALIHLVIFSHPLVAIYNLHSLALGAVVGHVGFDKIEAGEEGGLDTHAYAHYLHHKYFEVNYADGLIPFDKWFGTWHDGTKDGDEAMNARWQKKLQRENARKEAQEGNKA